MMSVSCASATGAANAAGSGGTDDETSWVGTWACAQYLTETGNMPPVSLGDKTLRQVVRVSLAGSRVRVKFSNRCGTGPLEIKEARLAVSAGASAINAATDVALRFGGQAGTTIAAGSETWSDATEYALPALTKMAITIVYGAVPSALTGHPGSRTTSYILAGAAANAASFAAPATTDHWYTIAGIDVPAGAGASGAVVCLGDSITDGRGTTTNAQNRWTDTLSTRLAGNPATASLGVINQGIGGTLVTGSGVQRFSRDVLGQSGATHLIMLYGINDIIYANASATTITATYKSLIAKAREAGLKAYGGTILPFGKCGDYSASREAVRQAVNQWIRTATAESGGFDAYIDFDAAMRDPADETKLLPAYDTDGLHPGPAGYARMGESIDLSLFE